MVGLSGVVSVIQRDFVIMLPQPKRPATSRAEKDAQKVTMAETALQANPIGWDWAQRMECNSMKNEAGDRRSGMKMSSKLKIPSNTKST